MGKNRYINTKFWSDNWIVELDPLERYLFLYLLTNEHTNLCGIYELSLKVLARETGLEMELIEKLFKRFTGKVYYFDGWVYLKNFTKHQVDNASIRLGIEKSLAIIPNEIKEKIAKLDTGWGENGVRVGTVGGESKPKSKSKSKLESKSKSELNIIADKSADPVNQIFDIFYKINPTLNFGNKSQRSVIEGLVLKFGLEKVKNMTEYACSVQGDKFAPVITNPLQLRDKLSALMGYYKRQAGNGPPTINLDL